MGKPFFRLLFEISSGFLEFSQACYLASVFSMYLSLSCVTSTNGKHFDDKIDGGAKAQTQNQKYCFGLSTLPALLGFHNVHLVFAGFLISEAFNLRTTGNKHFAHSHMCYRTTSIHDYRWTYKMCFYL